MKVKLTMKDVAKIRLLKSGIYNKFDSIEECVYKLIGIQAQYNQFAMLSIYNRVKGARLEDIGGLGKKYKLIGAWGQRMTLHIYLVEDWSIINSIYSSRKNWVKTHLKKIEVDSEEVLEEIDDVGRHKKIITKEDIKEILDPKKSKEIMLWGGIVIEASLRGILFGLVSSNNEKKYVHSNVIGRNKEKLKEEVLKKLIERYFLNYAPATINDFKHWSGLNQYEFLEQFNELKKKMLSLDVDGDEYFILKEDYEEHDKDKRQIASTLKVLGKFDPLLLCYKNKEWITEEKYIKKIWGKGGQVEAVIIKDCRIIGTWRYKIKGNMMNFNINQFEELTDKDIKEVELQLKEITDFYERDMGEVSIGRNEDN